jgi:5-carboxymethyl-2-hydroxymuconate isomerase
MPHFILDCSERILEIHEPKKTIEAVFETAFETGLFERDDIKVRLNPFKYSLVQSGEADFIHVFGNIMQGRTDAQKADLSKKIVTKLNELFPEVPIISMNIRDFEKASYCNKTMV